jgi:hypothetical protein
LLQRALFNILRVCSHFHRYDISVRTMRNKTLLWDLPESSTLLKFPLSFRAVGVHSRDILFRILLFELSSVAIELSGVAIVAVSN